MVFMDEKTVIDWTYARQNKIIYVVMEQNPYGKNL